MGFNSSGHLTRRLRVNQSFPGFRLWDSGGQEKMRQPSTAWKSFSPAAENR
jgi:hypothetical protein